MGPRTTKTGAKVRFTEEMRGFMSFGEDDFERGATLGRAANTSLMFHLTIETPAIDDFLADPARTADARGWVRSEALGGRRVVERGVFNLFVATDRPGERRMLYRLHFTDGVGTPLTLVGHKTIVDDPGFDLWPDTTTLFTRLLAGHTEVGEDESAELVASGILRITPTSFARQLTTFRARGAGAVGRLAALARFGLHFVGQLWTIYGKISRREVVP
jgi:cholesterol oxidase